MDEGESVVYLAATADYQGAMVFVFQNGKVAKVEMSAYETKTRRKKLISAYCDKFPLCQALYLQEDRELMLTSSGGEGASGAYSSAGIEVHQEHPGHPGDAAEEKRCGGFGECSAKGCCLTLTGSGPRAFPARGSSPAGKRKGSS